MSMMGPNIGKSEIGETVATFSEYSAAQKAVSSLIEADVAPRDISIVGTGLRSVEKVTGKLGYLTAARAGLINGLFLGLAACAIQVIFVPEAPVTVFFGTILICIAMGMLISFMSFLIARRRRTFVSMMAVSAEHYDVTVQSTSIHKAREVMAKTGAVKPRAPRVIDNAPPQYGERLPGYGTSSPESAGSVSSNPATSQGE